LLLVGDDELVGFWSHDMLYTSAMEDHWLFFRERGEGCYAYLRPGTMRGSVFTWRLDGDRLTTRAVRLVRPPRRPAPLLAGAPSTFLPGMTGGR
jgi:hypothetical protein